MQSNEVMSVAQLSSQCSMESKPVCSDEIQSVEIMSVAQLSSQCSTESKPVCSEMGSIRAESIGMSVAQLSKPSVCTQPRGDVKARESQEVANTKASQIAKPKVGNDGVRGVTGAGRGKGRGDFETTKTDDSIFMKKKKIIQTKIGKLHIIFEGDEVRRNKSKTLQKFTESSPMKRKLEVSKNTSNLVDIFSRNIESNPAVESESKDSPAKRRKYYRVCGGGGRGG